MTDNNAALMKNIFWKWHTEISEVAKSSGISEGFLAALVANESGGNADAKRFEKNALLELWEVVQRRKPAFGSINLTSLGNYLIEQGSFVAAFHALDELATSWGLTQIMGYNILPSPVQGRIEYLKQPKGNLGFVPILLSGFARVHQLDLTKDFDKMFACWNTGGPDPAKTHDPEYVPNGLARMKLYLEISAEAEKQIAGQTSAPTQRKSQDAVTVPSSEPGQAGS